MKYIDAEKLIEQLEEMKRAEYENCGGVNSKTGALQEVQELITSLQQERSENEEKFMNFFDAVGDCGFSQHDILLLKNIWKEAGCPPPESQVIDASKMEQPEFPNGKFVFPKYLYARTKDNKTIDMSYAPQDMTAVEYIRNDFVEQEQPEGLHFTPLNRLIQKIPSKNWNNTVNNYAKKLRDCLIKEGYLKDAEVLQGYISYMNGNNVPMATMDEQEQPEVDLEKFTEKIKTFQGRYKHPEIVSIKGAMAFMARMFYQYPNVARQWYEQLPKTTMD